MPAAPQTFGRRAPIAPAAAAPAAAAPAAKAPAAKVPERREAIVAPDPELSPEIALEQELREWRRQRSFQIPWRPVSWMASLSFGIASLVLPDSVNDSVDWLLYALMAASFCAGFIKRREAKNVQSPL